MKKTILSTMLLAAAFMGFTSCADDNDYTPTTLASETTEEQECELDYDKLASASINEFLNFAKTPRYGYHLDKAQAYLMNWATRHGFVPQTDEQQNVWFDVPATPGMESRPKVILQAHMDQICASEPGKTYDYTQVVGEPYYDGDLLKGHNVNLGADDGSGVGIELAIAASNVPHGPLRILITTNEDYTMEGAEKLSSDVLDAEYLINIDNEWLGEIAIGCYGGFKEDCSKDYQRTMVGADMQKVIFTVDGLSGGHSGVEIGNGHLSASVILDDVLNGVMMQHNAQFVDLNCGTYANAIPAVLDLSFAVKSSEAAAVKAQLESMVADYKVAYPNEKGVWNVKVSAMNAGEMVYDNTVLTDLQYLFNNIQQGVIEWNRVDKRVTRSCNIGVVSLTDGHFDFQYFPRSDFNSWVDEQFAYVDLYASTVGMSTLTTSHTPCWESDGQDALTQMMVQYHNQFGIENKVVKAPGGLETAYFSQKNPNMKCVSVGPTIDNAHTIDEALHVSTVKPLVQVIVNVLGNIR